MATSDPLHSSATVEVLGTCGLACAQACSGAERHHTTEGSVAIWAVVLVSVFLALDAVIACVAVQRIGRVPQTNSALRPGASRDSGLAPVECAPPPAARGRFGQVDASALRVTFGRG